MVKTSAPRSTTNRAVFVIVLAACTSLACLSKAAGETVIISIKQGPNRFEPMSQAVKVGDTVKWVSEGGTHTVTPDDGQTDPFQGSSTLTGANATYSLPEMIKGPPRTIKYHCNIHPTQMKGELVIKPGS
jgi:plastocyanin